MSGEEEQHHEKSSVSFLVPDDKDADGKKQQPSMGKRRSSLFNRARMSFVRYVRGSVVGVSRGDRPYSERDRLARSVLFRFFP